MISAKPVAGTMSVGEWRESTADIIISRLLWPRVISWSPL
jgi:hypothetical protein